MRVEEVALWASLLASVATFLGIPIALFAFHLDQRRTRQERELSAFLTLNSLYMEHLRICLEHPEVEPVETILGIGSRSRLDERQRREVVVLLMVVSMMETAYFLYRDQTSSFRRRQWSGWEGYIRMWCRHPGFRAHWPGIVEQFDTEFAEHIRRIYVQVSLETNGGGATTGHDQAEKG